MAIERTFTMLKPGVLSRRIMGEVLTRIERKGFDIIAAKLVRIPRAMAETHYGEHRGKPFFEELVAYITSGPVFAMVLEGDESISLLRTLCGSTRAQDAAPGTIRGDYAMHTGLNIIHASDSAESAQREIALFFKPEEIMDWQDGNDPWI
ncbi:MAG: nucleoside-diphosphate kinase [Spirochaetales bacterium]|nr:nucleoside-diphosphate kinase [Spirochaetales bacterium]